MSTKADARAAEFSDLQETASPEGKRDVNLDVILDVPVTLSMEVGRTRIPIRNLLQLNQGSVVAHGEVVVVNEKFGIRLTDVISPAERIRKLR
jgi:flagellar motor switch protein FliN/FliY